MHLLQLFSLIGAQLSMWDSRMHVDVFLRHNNGAQWQGCDLI